MVLLEHLLEDFSMPFNYAYKFGHAVKIGVDYGKSCDRGKDHQKSADIGAVIYNAEPAQMETLWIRENPDPMDTNIIETWMKKILKPYIAHGSEWFRVTPEVLYFILSDPYLIWVNDLKRDPYPEPAKIDMIRKKFSLKGEKKCITTHI
jgi:hypothetical protein